MQILMHTLTRLETKFISDPKLRVFLPTVNFSFSAEFQVGAGFDRPPKSRQHRKFRGLLFLLPSLPRGVTLAWLLW